VVYFESEIFPADSAARYSGGMSDVRPEAVDAILTFLSSRGCANWYTIDRALSGRDGIIGPFMAELKFLVARGDLINEGNDFRLAMPRGHQHNPDQ